MNRQLNRLAVVALVLLAALVVGTTYWQTWAAAGLQDRQDNAIQRVVQFTVARGLIEGADGRTVLASNRRKRVGGQTLYFRHYPQHGLAAQTVGYSTTGRSQAGLERSMNDYLTGANTSLSNAFRNLLDRLGNATVHGNNLKLTIRPRAQRLAQQLLGSRCGAVVAMNPHTGAVYVMASSPTYDPNQIATHDVQAAQKAYDGLLKDPGRPLTNRAAREIDLARAIARGVQRYRRDLVLVGLAGSKQVEAAEEIALPAAGAVAVGAATHLRRAGRRLALLFLQGRQLLGEFHSRTS